MSVMDKYKNSAGGIGEYAAQHKKYESEISSLSDDKAGKERSYTNSKSELEGMNREDDPAAYDTKEAEAENAKGSFQEAETALSDKETEFDQYKEANPTYSSLMEQQSEIEEAKEGIQTVEEEKEASTEEVGQKLDSHVQQAEEATPSEVGQDNVNVSGGYDKDNTDYTPSNDHLKAALDKGKEQDPELEGNLSQTQSQIQEQDNEL